MLSLSSPPWLLLLVLFLFANGSAPVVSLAENVTLATLPSTSPISVSFSTTSSVVAPISTELENQTASSSNINTNNEASDEQTGNSNSNMSSHSRNINGLPSSNSNIDNANSNSSSVSSLSTTTSAISGVDQQESLILATPTALNGSGTPPEHQTIGQAPPTKGEQEAILRALDWLKEKRASDYGWGNDTHVVILAKELSGGRDPNDSVDGHVQVIQELEDTLSVKEMEIEILAMLDRHHTLPKPLDLDKLARYVLALGSLCKDPKHFHGHDLVATLQHHEPAQDIEFALTTLSACSSAAHVRKRQIRRLLDIASGVTDQSVDAIAMVILALRCIVTDHRHRHLQHFVRRPARGLASLQDQRGSFGSLRSTALAMQALQDLEYDPAGHWNRTAASRYILSRQRADGGWSEEPLQDGQEPDIGVGLTADIILALGWKGLGAVRALQCDHVIRESSDPTGEYGLCGLVHRLANR